MNQLCISVNRTIGSDRKPVRQKERCGGREGGSKRGQRAATLRGHDEDTVRAE